MFNFFKSVAAAVWKKINLWRRQTSGSFVGQSFDLHLTKRVKSKRFPSWRQLTNIGHILSVPEGRILKLNFFVFAIGIVWLGILLVLNHSIEAPAVGGRYVEAEVGSPQYINPIFANVNDVDLDITRLVYSGLMRYDEKNRLIPDLAASYEVSVDKKVYTFYLKKDVVWHDGEPFIATDVIFTFDTIQNPLVSSPLSVSFQGVEVSATDDYTVRFVLSEPFAPFLSSLTVGILPEHAWFNIPPEQMRLSQMNTQPVGTGSFMFKKFTKDDMGRILTYELERFDRFYRQPAYLQDFVFQFFSDYEGDDGAVQALRSQKVTGLNFVPKDLRDKVERKHIDLHTLQLPQYSALFFNQSHNKSLADVKVRKALSMAVDKDRILREAIKSEGQIVNSPVLSGFPGYDIGAGVVNFSFEEANKILDQNWPRISAEEYRKSRKEALLKEWEKANPDTASSTPALTVASTTDSQAVTSTTSREEAEKEIDKQLDQELNIAQTFYRRDKENNILELSLVTADVEEYKRAAELVVGFWQEVGVKTSARFVSPRDIVHDVFRNRDYDVLLYSVIIGGDPDQYPFWHSSQIDYPGLNLSRYANHNVDSLLVKIRETTNDADTADLYKKLQEAVLADMPAVFLYMPTYTYATLDQVRGVDVERISHPADRFSDVVTWYMKTKWDWQW